MRASTAREPGGLPGRYVEFEASLTVCKRALAYEWRDLRQRDKLRIGLRRQRGMVKP
jgi:hypothetical protein